jgi:hypothetical protein
MNARLRLAGFTALAVGVGLAASTAVGQPPPPPPPENKVEWDPPPKNGNNPDSPAAKTVTGKGTVTTKTGWKCTEVIVDVVEIPTFVVIDQLKGPPTGKAWSFSTSNANSNTTCVVTVTAKFEEIANPANKETKSHTPRTVSVK